MDWVVTGWIEHLYTNPNCRIGRTRGTMSPNRKDRDEVFHEVETPILDQDRSQPFDKLHFLWLIYQVYQENLIGIRKIFSYVFGRT